MRRSRGHSPVIAGFFSFFTLVVLAMGCGNVKSKDFRKDAGNGAFQKPTEEEFSGTPADLNGTWTGPCASVEGGRAQTDCSATVTIRQTKMLAGRNTFSFSFQYSLGKRNMPTPFLSAPYWVADNDLTDGSQRVGKIGKGALSLPFEQTFQDLAIRVIAGQRITFMAARVPTVNFTFDFASTSSACPDGYCFTALLDKQ